MKKLQPFHRVYIIQIEIEIAIEIEIDRNSTPISIVMKSLKGSSFKVRCQNFF